MKTMMYPKTYGVVFDIDRSHPKPILTVRRGDGKKVKLNFKNRSGRWSSKDVHLGDVVKMYNRPFESVTRFRRFGE